MPSSSLYSAVLLQLHIESVMGLIGRTQHKVGSENYAEEIHMLAHLAHSAEVAESMAYMAGTVEGPPSVEGACLRGLVTLALLLAVDDHFAPQ